MSSIENYYTIIVITIFLIIIYCYIIQYKYKLSEDFVPLKYIRSYKEINDLEKMMIDVIKLFEQYKINYWVTNNTLLGIINYKGILPWLEHNELEFCIMKHDTNKLDNIFLLYNNYLLKKYQNFYVIRNSNNNIKLLIFVSTYINNKIVYYDHNMKNKYYFWIDELFPITKRDFRDTQINTPFDSHSILSRLFGNEWNKTMSRENKIYDISHSNQKPFMWVYWDNINKTEIPSKTLTKSSTKTPECIQLCHETKIKNCANSFNLVFLNANNIKQFLPELNDIASDIEHLVIAHKVDIYRIMLLYKYGGLYVDADIIIIRDPIEIMDKLNLYDFIGFGCSGHICTDGYMRPSNWIMGSRAYSPLIKEILDELLKKILSYKISKTKSIAYHDLGKLLIWEKLKLLHKTDEYKYYHFSNIYDGIRDKYGIWVTTEKLFSNQPIEYDNENKFMFMVFYFSEASNEIKNMSRHHLLYSDMNISKFYRKALDIL